jgi:hypothetical protein
MFKAAKGLPAILCSLVALTAVAQEGLLPDFSEAKTPHLFTVSVDTLDPGSFMFDLDSFQALPAWEEASRQNLLENRLLAWLHAELQMRLPVPATQDLLAEIRNANLFFLYQTDEAGNIDRDACGRPVLRKSDGLWGETGDLSGWHNRITTAIDTLMREWEEKADLICQELLSILPVNLSAPGEQQLFATLSEYTQSAEREFERLYRQEESLFLHARLRDAVSLREQREAQTASALTRAIISDTDTILSGIKQQLAEDLSPAADPTQTLPGGAESTVENWRSYFQQELKKACEVWNQAESRLITERIRWERDAEAGFLAGEEAWDNAFAELRQARGSWLEEFARLTQEGAENWLELEDSLLAGWEQAAAELFASSARESARMQAEITSLLDDYRRSRDFMTLAENSIAELRRQISRTDDSSQRALCEEETAYWQEIHSRYSGRAETALWNLRALETEILTESGPGFDDPYTLELERLEAKAGLLRRQAEIAAAVVRYAECRSSERPTEAQTAVLLEQARMRFADAEQEYLAALDLLGEAGGTPAGLENDPDAVYKTAREAADRAYEACREAGYRLQEAEEIDSYARSGSVEDGVDPREIMEHRLAEYEHSRRVLDLLTSLYKAKEEKLPFAERNPAYAALEEEQTRLLGTQILLDHTWKRLAERIQHLGQDSAQALADFGAAVGALVDLGDLPFSLVAETLNPSMPDKADIEALTDFNSPEALTEDALADYFSNSNGAFLRDTLIWLRELEKLITPEDLEGDGLIYRELNLPPFINNHPKIYVPQGLADTGLLGLLKDFAFAYSYETDEVKVAAESQQAYGLLCDEIDVNPDAYLRNLGERALKHLQADPGLYKLYSFFKLLLTEEKLLADTAFMGRDLSYEAVKFLKAEANDAIDDIKKKYPIIHIFWFNKKKRIREYRDSLQSLHGGEGKKLLIESILDLAGYAHTCSDCEKELTLLHGEPGMSCPKFLQVLNLVLDREIEPETAASIEGLFAAETGTSESTFTLLENLILRAETLCAEKQAEIDALLVSQRSARVEDAAVYRRLLENPDASLQELTDAARKLFYNPKFTETDLLRSNYEQAEKLLHFTPGAELPAMQLRCGALLALFNLKLAAAAQAHISEHSLQLELLQSRRCEWQVMIERLYAAGLREWEGGFAVLDEKRGNWERDFLAEYEEKVVLWDQKYKLFGLARQNWLEESSARAYTAACSALAREMRIKADSLSAGVESIFIPDMTSGTPRLSALIRRLSGREGLETLLEKTRESSRGISVHALLRPTSLPCFSSYRKNSLALQELQSELGSEIYQKAALVQALRLREIVSRTREEVYEAVEDANENVGRQIGNTLEAAGYRRQGPDFRRSALIDRSILGGTEKEQQYIRGYRDYQAPPLEMGVNLDRPALESLSGDMIQDSVSKAVARLQEYLQLIFGQKDLEEAVDISEGFRVLMEKEREEFRSSAQYGEYTELNGLFAMHVGYAPVMQEENPEKVAQAGYGEYGRIFELYLRNEARLSRGLATLSVPLYDLRLWDDDRDNDGEPDGWFHAPTPRGLIDLSVSIIGTMLLGPGTGMLALTLVDDAVFTGLDLAGGRTDWAEAGIDMGKKGLAGLVSQGFASFNAAAMTQMGGSLEGVIAKTLYTGSSRFAENMATGIVGALEIQGNGLTLNSDLLEDSIVGRRALVDVAAGISGTMVRESLNTLNLSNEDTAGFSRLHIENAAAFNSTLGSLASAGVELGLGGRTSLNILNLRDFSSRAPEHGLLELSLSGRNSFLNIGAAGYDLSPSRLARTVSGFQVHLINRRIKGFAAAFEEASGYTTDIMLRAEYSFGDSRGRTTLGNILSGKDLLHIGLAGAKGMTVRRGDGGRDIYLQTVGAGLDEQLYASVILQHEAYRDGIVTADNYLETREAVTARIQMAERILPDYGDEFILEHEPLVKDFIAYEMSHHLGQDFWNEYIDNSYSSREDFARRILNWERKGRVGVIPTADAFGVTDTLLGGFAALGRMLHISKVERLDITAKPPGELADMLAGSLSLISLATSFSTSGLAESWSAANLVDFTFSVLSPLPKLPNGTLGGILNFSAAVSQNLLQAREVMRYVLRDDLDECQRWHGEINRDRTIFSMAEEIGIDLSIPYSENRSEDYYRIVEQQMVMRYIWLGNRIFNDKITDPEDLKMLFYGPYVEVFDEEHGLRQYQKLPGYIDKEYSEFFGMGDHSILEDDFFSEYEANFEMANLLHHKSYLSAPVNWPFDIQENVYIKWEDEASRYNYYYSYTSYWELRYKNLMLSLEE